MQGEMRMEIRVLRYFLTVVREESITKAAEMLHITQPTLSRQLAQLEEETGVKLFNRGSRKITLTSEGILLRRRAEEIIELVDKTSHDLLKQENELKGKITIGYGELKSVQTLSKLCKMFHEKYPQVTFEVYTATADAVKERMDRGLIDIGLLLEPVSMEKYDYIRMPIKEEWCVLMRPDDPLAEKSSITANDLESQPLILPQRLNVQSELANWFGNSFEKINLVISGNLSTNSAIMTMNGLGYALVINGSTSLWDSTKLISKPLSPILTSTTVLAWKHGQPFSPAVEKFIHHLKCLLSMTCQTI